MKRDTKEIITPIGKHKVVLKEWITGREKREIRKPYLEGMKFSLEEGKAKTEEIDANALIEKSENKAIETIVVSIDDDKEKILEKILDMRDKDYEFIVDEINKITKGENFIKP